MDLDQLPLAAAAPEWYSEKAATIACYAVASGIFTVLGVAPPVLGSKTVTDLLLNGLTGPVGACFAVEPDPQKAAALIARHIDPVEKKPLFHFLPGSRSYSIATPGCNFRCKHCQNADISQLPRDRGGMIVGEGVEPASLGALTMPDVSRCTIVTFAAPAANCAFEKA